MDQKINFEQINNATTPGLKRKTPSTMPSLNDTTSTTSKRPHLTREPETPATTPTKSTHASLLDSLPSTPTTPTTPFTLSKPQKRSSRKQRIPNDPLNTTVCRLRKEGLGWDDIATRTSQECGLSGEDELTAAAVYSRFMRNGPLVARSQGEQWNGEDYVHMKKAKNGGGEDMTKKQLVKGDDDFNVPRCGVSGMTKSEEQDIVMAVESAKENFWRNVTAVVNGKLEGRALTEIEVKQAYDRIHGDDT